MRNELRRIGEEAAVVYLMALFRQDPRGTANDSIKISARTVGTGLELGTMHKASTPPPKFRVQLAPHKQSNATSFCYLQTRYTTIYTSYVKLSIYKGPLEETEICYGDHHMVEENHNGLLLLIRARTPNEIEHLEDQDVDGG